MHFSMAIEEVLPIWQLLKVVEKEIGGKDLRDLSIQRFGKTTLEHKLQQILSLEGRLQGPSFMQLSIIGLDPN